MIIYNAFNCQPVKLKNSGLAYVLSQERLDSFSHMPASISSMYSSMEYVLLHSMQRN